jgi:hypothetical protein
MRRGSIIGGIILIAVGVFFLILPFFPNLADFLNIQQQWPLIIIAVGALFLLGAVMGTPGLAVPGSIMTGIGALLYFQNLLDAWDTWAFAWTLIIGFVGLGVILSNVLQGTGRKGVREGGKLVLISLIMFLVFGSLFSGWFSLGIIFALLLIGIGLSIFARALKKEV